MTDTRPRLIPDEKHPITIEAAGKTVTVTRGPAQVARSEKALALQESNYPVVYYIPLEDVDPSLLAGSDLHTYCPYKGEASYYSIPAGGDRSINAVWSYEAPFEAMKQIKGYVAFYPDRVDQIS